MEGTTDRETAIITDWMTETIEFNNVTAIIRTLRTSKVNPIPVASLRTYSIGSTSIGNLKDDWSTAYTLAHEIAERTPVSKYMNTQQDTRPTHLYFNRLLSVDDTYKNNTVQDIVDTLPVKVKYCSTWAELSENMKFLPKTICFHISELTHSSAIEIVNMIHTLAKLLDNKENITVSVSVEKDTTLQAIKDLQKSNIFGIVPGMKSFGKEETLKGLQAQWNNIPYWPKHILDQLDGAKKPIAKQKTGEIKLTPRQEQILFLIRERGSSNKVIAKTLNITESTVKLHVGLVLKKFGVKNRTQLAVFSKK